MLVVVRCAELPEVLEDPRLFTRCFRFRLGTDPSQLAQFSESYVRSAWRPAIGMAAPIPAEMTISIGSFRKTTSAITRLISSTSAMCTLTNNAEQIRAAYGQLDRRGVNGPAVPALLLGRIVMTGGQSIRRHSNADPVAAARAFTV
jgi:hypothetical protein